MMELECKEATKQFEALRREVDERRIVSQWFNRVRRKRQINGKSIVRGN